MPHIGKLHLNPPYAEAIEHYSLPSEPLAKNRCTAPAINGAMEITFNCGQSSSGWLTVSVTNTSRTAGGLSLLRPSRPKSPCTGATVIPATPPARLDPGAPAARRPAIPRRDWQAHDRAQPGRELERQLGCPREHERSPRSAGSANPL